MSTSRNCALAHAGSTRPSQVAFPARARRVRGSAVPSPVPSPCCPRLPRGGRPTRRSQRGEHQRAEEPHRGDTDFSLPLPTVTDKGRDKNQVSEPTGDAGGATPPEGTTHRPSSSGQLRSHTQGPVIGAVAQGRWSTVCPRHHNRQHKLSHADTDTQGLSCSDGPAGLLARAAHSCTETQTQPARDTALGGHSPSHPCCPSVVSTWLAPSSENHFQSRVGRKGNK